MSPRGQTEPALCAENPWTGFPLESKKLKTGASSGNDAVASALAWGLWSTARTPVSRMTWRGNGVLTFHVAMLETKRVLGKVPLRSPVSIFAGFMYKARNRHVPPKPCMVGTVRSMEILKFAEVAPGGPVMITSLSCMVEVPLFSPQRLPQLQDQSI